MGAPLFVLCYWRLFVKESSEHGQSPSGQHVEIHCETILDTSLGWLASLSLAIDGA